VIRYVSDPSDTPIATAVENVISSVFVALTRALAITAPDVIVPRHCTKTWSVVNSPVTVWVTTVLTSAAIAPAANVMSRLKICVTAVALGIAGRPDIPPGTDELVRNPMRFPVLREASSGPGATPAASFPAGWFPSRGLWRRW